VEDTHGSLKAGRNANAQSSDDSEARILPVS
jgi:hypothetical protein